MVFYFCRNRIIGWLSAWGAAVVLALAAAVPAGAEDQTPPAIQVLPVDGASDVRVDSQITVTFGESVKLGNGAAITSRNAGSLFVLSQLNDNQSVEVSVSWSESKKRLTIKPKKPLAFGETYQLKIPAGKVIDRAGNGNQAVQVIFRTEEAGPPLGVTVQPANEETNVPVDSLIRLMFNKPVTRANKTEITNDAIANIIKINDSKGRRVDFIGSWDADSRMITLDPVGNLNGGTTYTVTLLENKIMDRQGVKNPLVISRFTTRQALDTISPVVTINPAHGSSNVALSPKITLQFAEDVLLPDGTPLSSKAVKGMVLFYDEKGTQIDYSATWNKSKRTITLKVKGSLQNYTTYTLILPAGCVKDLGGNINKQAVVTFTTGNR
jgi:methionine-rich copper-binding protein CopC